MQRASQVFYIDKKKKLMQNPSTYFLSLPVINQMMLNWEEFRMTAEKPSDREDEFFIKLDQKLIKEIRSDLDKRRAGEDQQKHKEEHWMKCPKCGSDLQEINYRNVMIDRCVECQGIWLDRGELNLLIEGQAQLTKGFINKLFSQK
jgi:hypothetical protein